MITGVITNYLPWAIYPINMIFTFCFTYISPIYAYYESFMRELGIGLIPALYLTIPIYFSIMYLLYLLRRIVTGEKRTQFITEFAQGELYRPRITEFGRKVVFTWNIFMCVLSTVLLLLSVLFYEQHARSHGQILETFTGYVNASFTPHQYSVLDVQSWAFPITGVQMEHFVISTKFLEWIDTIINILMGNSVILLHAWHHGSIVTSFMVGIYSSAGIVTLIFNSFIHVIMYLYYALSVVRSLRPYLNMFKIVITTTQIVQFLTALWCGMLHLHKQYEKIALNYYNMPQHMRYEGFPSGNLVIFNYMAMFFVVTYLTLFLDFFVKSYISKNKENKTK